MDISRNIATAALARSANWSAIRALNVQATPGLRRCARSLTNHRHLTSTSSLRQAQEQRSNDGGNTHGTPFPQPVITRSEEIMRISFRPQEERNIKSPTRERLRALERDVLNSARTVPDTLSDPASTGMRLASADREQILDEGSDSVADAPLPAFEEGALVDFGDSRSILLPGDLVEFRLAGNRAELAIFIRQLETQGQYYTMSGRWLQKSSFQARFFVPHFVSPEEIEPLLAYLPDSDVPAALQNQLQKLENSLPRNIGGPLLSKMRDFRRKADNIYREHAAILDGAYDALAQPLGTIYVSLSYAVQILLPGPDDNNLPGSRQAWMKDNMAAVYAVYRALRDVNIGIRPIKTTNVRSWGKYEIVAKNIRDTITVTMNIVRLWQRQDSLQRVDSTFGQFIKKAQSAIDQSRRHRDPTVYGQVGPAKDASGPSQKIAHNHFNAHDLIFIRFIQCWAGWESFSADSDAASTGSAILRAIGRYDDYNLGRYTAWLLLQELGYIKPWDIPTYYKMRSTKGYRYQDSFIKGPSREVKGRGHAASQELEAEVKDLLDNGADAVADLRQDWNDLRAFCIDDPSANEIDDALSVTKTATDGVYWVHIHVADPASMISPTQSRVMQTAQSKMANTYLPGKVITMLPEELVQKKLSLAPGRPTLTFSVKVNSQGEMLDHRITPGLINNVVYVSPATAAVVCGHSGEPVSQTILQVGNEPGEGGSSGGVSRHMTSIDELETSDKEDLELLASLGAARRKRNLLRGGVGFQTFFHDVSFKLAPELDEEKSTNIRDTKHFLGDPFISLVARTPITEGDISSLMVLAAEVAAKWCSDRNIPTIYRVTQKYAGNGDPSALFRKNILPYYLRDETPPPDLLSEYVKSIGSILPSAVPGPHVQLGVDGFSRCTSPLRRYSDMITHWQIQAALLQEAKTGESLVGSTDQSYLPFSQERVERLIPKQGEIDHASREDSEKSKREYATQALLRAWKFGEGKSKLPETFTFNVFQADESRIAGSLEELGMRAEMVPPEFPNGPTEVTVGDVFEVRLLTVNPYQRRIEVAAVAKKDAEEMKMMGNLITSL